MSALFWALVLALWLRAMIHCPWVFEWFWKGQLHGAQVLEVHDWNCARVYWPPGGIERDVRFRLRGPTNGRRRDE